MCTGLIWLSTVEKLWPLKNSFRCRQLIFEALRQRRVTANEDVKILFDQFKPLLAVNFAQYNLFLTVFEVMTFLCTNIQGHGRLQEMFTTH